MITENDLLSLRYKVITRLEDNDNTVEFYHEDHDNMSYLVKLRKGEIQTVLPDEIDNRSWRTASLEQFMKWQYLYMQAKALIL